MAVEKKDVHSHCIDQTKGAKINKVYLIVLWDN